MTHTLNPGLHIAIVTCPRGGYGGSLLAWETYQACKKKNIPAILATFDFYRPYPHDLGSDLRRLSIATNQITGKFETDVLSEIASIVAEAKENGKFLIIDTQAGFLPESRMFEVLSHAGLANADSAAALVAVRHGDEIYWDPFEAIGIPIDRAMFRYWGFRSEASVLANNETTTRWIPRFLQTGLLDVINRGSKDEIPKEIDDEFGDLLPSHNQKSNQDEVADHIEDATKHIFPAILEPISKPVQEMSISDLPEIW